ncbi:MAG TPA: hypothetical protein VFR01_03545 [Geobacterales bacterium]|nr:hypothetical protein [Geobacterales bacterium]
MQLWPHEDAVGPLMTHWGNWTLFLSPKGVTGYRYTFFESFRLYLRLHYGTFAAKDPHERLKHQLWNEPGEPLPFHQERVRQFPIQELAAIEVIYNKALAHKLVLHRVGGDRVSYGIAERKSVFAIRDTLKGLYGYLVRETGF